MGGEEGCPNVCYEDTSIGAPCNERCEDPGVLSCDNCIDPCDSDNSCSPHFYCQCLDEEHYKCWANALAYLKYYEWEC